MKENQNLIGVLNPYLNKEKIDNLNKKAQLLELLPRITRAQSMDILSSQANLAGYKAVVDHFHILKSNPYDDDSSRNHSTSAKYNVGAGVAGLQASKCKKDGCYGFCNRCKNGFQRAS